MPSDEFVAAFDRGDSVDELAERFGVPESWVMERMKLLAMTHGAGQCHAA